MGQMLQRAQQRLMGERAGGDTAAPEFRNALIAAGADRTDGPYAWGALLALLRALLPAIQPCAPAVALEMLGFAIWAGPKYTTGRKLPGQLMLSQLQCSVSEAGKKPERTAPAAPARRKDQEPNAPRAPPTRRRAGRQWQQLSPQRQTGRCCQWMRMVGGTLIPARRGATSSASG